MKKYSEPSHSDADYLMINIESICAIQCKKTGYNLFLRKGGQISVSKAIGDAIVEDYEKLNMSSPLWGSRVSRANKDSASSREEAVQIPGREDPFFPSGRERPPGTFEFASSHMMPPPTSPFHTPPGYAPFEFFDPPPKGGFK